MIMVRLQRDTGRTLSRGEKNKVRIQSIRETAVYNFFPSLYQRIKTRATKIHGEHVGEYLGPKGDQWGLPGAGWVAINQVPGCPRGCDSSSGRFYPCFYPSHFVGDVRRRGRPGLESNPRYDPDCLSPARGLNQTLNLVDRSVTVRSVLARGLNMFRGWTE